MQFVVKKINNDDIVNEMARIGFDADYLLKGAQKHRFISLKIFGLSLPQANILKQTALSLGADCALHKEVLVSSIDKTDCILSGTYGKLLEISSKLKRQQFSMPKLADEILEAVVNFEKKAPPVIMGILNLTENSFSDGGMYSNPNEAVAHVLDMIEEGAKIIDVGAESTAPRAVPVHVDIEIGRVVPVISKIKELAPDVSISIDTRNSETAEAAIRAGADIVNDVSGFSWDEKIINVAYKYKKKYVLTHSIGTPENMDEMNHYINLVDDIYSELKTKADFLLEKGFEPDDLIIDVGFGFAKDVEQNYELMTKISDFRSLGYKILVGTSRKRFLSDLRKNSEKPILDDITALSSFYLAEHGASILRVHDVAKTKLALDFLSRLSR